MRFMNALALAAAVIAAPAAAHQPGPDLDSAMGKRERYFQALDKEAPGFTLRNAEGDAVRLADFRGKVVILHFIYTDCPDVCPLHADRIAEVQAVVNRTAMKAQVQFVSITTDPEHDSSEVLRNYGPTHGLDRANWTFLTTTSDQSEDATRKIAAAYGHKFVVAENRYQVHGVVTHVIDTKGRWRANFHGLRFEPSNLVRFIRALVDERPRTKLQSNRSLVDEVHRPIRWQENRDGR